MNTEFKKDDETLYMRNVSHVMVVNMGTQKSFYLLINTKLQYVLIALINFFWLIK